jgi:hypothetical protein
MGVCLKKTPELVEQIIELVGSGTPITHAAQACGIDRGTVYDWLENDPTFTTEIKKRRSLAVHERVEAIRAAQNKNWTAAAWYLERQYPEEFGIRPEKKDIKITVEIRHCAGDPDPRLPEPEAVELLECLGIEE